jgi:hypothetical protein
MMSLGNRVAAEGVSAMIISEGHARALLHGLVREHSARARATARSVGAALRRLPAKRTRLAGFVECLRRQLAEDALVVQALCDKRRGELHAVLADCAVSPAGWHVDLQLLELALRPGRLPALRIGDIGVRITGHALERVFQRTRSTDWRRVIAELEPAAIMMGWLQQPLSGLGYAQAAVQTRSGLLLGEVSGDRRIVFKTFLRADEEDQIRHGDLRRALWGFWIRNGGGRVLGEALFGARETQDRLIAEAQDLLLAHPWLGFRHLPGEDREARHWQLAPGALVG